MKYRMIQRCREAFPIRQMCRCLRVSSSGYLWLGDPATEWAGVKQRGRESLFYDRVHGAGGVTVFEIPAT
jgi:hypothetical protein